MKKEYLSEAFRQLELLNEEDFNLSTTADNSDLKDFLDNDDMSVMSLDVIDPEAETEEDLEDSYTGKVILDCCVCHSKLYKDKEEVQIDEEQDLANVGEECPFCYSNDGFKIIGEVAPYGETEEETEIEDEEHEDDVPEDFDESLKTRKTRKLKESVTDDYYDLIDSLAETASDYLKDNPEYDKYDAISDAVNTDLIYYADQWVILQELGESPLEYYTDDVWDALYEAIADKMEVPEEDDETNESLKTGKNKRLKESVKNGWRGSKDIEYVWKGPWSDPELVYDGKTFNYWDIEDALWSMFLEENPQWTDDDSNNPECEDEFNKYVQSEGALYLDDVIAGGYFDEPSEKNESVNESIQEIEIETGTDKIKIESEPKEESGETEDVLAPVSPETEHQIENNSSDEIDVPIDEFDEETFDELGESFLKNTYENVKGYKTESVKEQDGNKLVVEGLITFNSGKVKKTSFIFESKDITKSGKVRFIGENCQLSRGKKSFTIAGKVQEGKFISESLNYNYRAKDAKSGKSTRMYGTVRTNK